jgi:aquaporin Z
VASVPARADAGATLATVAPQGAQGGWHGAEWGCEFLGTALLLLGGLSAVVFDFGAGSPVGHAIPSHSVRLLMTGALFASCGALVTISPLGRRSGAHLNPAVTLAFWRLHHLGWSDLSGYIAAQVAGAICGAYGVQLLWGSRATSVTDGTTHPGGGVGPLAAVGLEAGMTALLILTIFTFVSSTRTAHWTPLAVAAVIAVLVWQCAPYTGTSLNPARSLGPAVVSGQFSDYWVYLAGPFSGTVLALGIWHLVPLNTLTAKLFHDARYRSVFASTLPTKH